MNTAIIVSLLAVAAAVALPRAPGPTKDLTFKEIRLQKPTLSAIDVSTLRPPPHPLPPALPHPLPKNGDGRRRPAARSRVRIVGGQQAQPGQFPYQAALTINQNIFCGGSLIGPSWVLTAAHCVQEANQVLVYLGAYDLSGGDDGRQITYASAAYVHGQYNANGNNNNDIALLKLATAAQYSGSIQDVPLAAGASSYEGYPAVVSGWGRYSDSVQQISPVLRYVEVQVISNQQCAAAYGPAIAPTNICTGSVDGGVGSTCNGDSGGPLVDEASGQQIGIVSFGSSSGCELGYPAAFTRVSSFRSWIQYVQSNRSGPLATTGDLRFISRIL